jgi:hypothetical protein
MMDEPEMLFVFNHGGDSAICKFERALRNEIEDHIKSLISALKRENGRLEGNVEPEMLFVFSHGGDSVEALKAEVALWREGTQIEALQAELEQERHQFVIYNEQRLGALAEVERLQAEAAAMAQAMADCERMLSLIANKYRLPLINSMPPLHEINSLIERLHKPTTAGQPILDRLQAQGVVIEAAKKR